MPRLTVPFANRKPLLLLAISANGRTIMLVGIVDSGADGTLLPKDAAPALGIPEADLVPEKKGAGGAAGTSFPAWTAPAGVTITGQVVRLVLGSPPRLGPWGPTFALTPKFAEKAFPLFGRADFFQPFTVTFGRDAQGVEVLHLDH